jgi:hypothetical protein
MLGSRSTTEPPRQSLAATFAFLSLSAFSCEMGAHGASRLME